MEVVQGEAEGMFLDTAATMRGLRAGARSLAEPGEVDEASELPPGPSIPSEERSA